MPTPVSLSDLYQASRERLALQTYALTGDVGATQAAVKDAFVAASQHWVKIAASPDPESQIRHRAWSSAQRRHSARRWHREKGLDEEQSLVLESLQKLDENERKALLLAYLAELPLRQVGRELAKTLEATAEYLEKATDRYVEALGINENDIAASVRLLESRVQDIQWPTPESIARSGKRRRRDQAVMGTAAGLAVMIGAGSLVSSPAAQTASAERESSAPVAREMLLTAGDVNRSLQGAWKVTQTNDNTKGTGRISACQRERFADEQGEGTLVRRIKAVPAKANPEQDEARLIQTVEVSSTANTAQRAYAHTRAWYAGCRVARMRLESAFSVKRVGDQAEIINLKLNDKPLRHVQIGIARVGALTVSTYMDSPTTAVPPTQIRQLLATSVNKLCAADPAGESCAAAKKGAVKKTRPPASGEVPGTLAAVDLPALGSIKRPWAGTEPAKANPNVAATPCDKSDFVAAGARKAKSRAYLIPNAKLPRRFGITQTYGTFKDVDAAHQFYSNIVTKLERCEDKDRGSSVSAEVVERSGPFNSSMALWRVESQINTDQETVDYWMGVVRVGNNVAQINFAGAATANMNQDTFARLIRRARERLYEITSTKTLVKPAKPKPLAAPKPKDDEA